MAAVTTIIAAIGLGIAAAGAGYTAYQQDQLAKASKKEEKLREKQMDLDATRKRREIIRQMLVHNAAARANASAQGVSIGDSSVQGAIGQQTNTAGQNILATNQSQEIGAGIFQANAQQSTAQAGIAWGQAFSSVGSGIMSNASTISRVGASAGLWKPDVA